jgi:hypothetical protein
MLKYLFAFYLIVFSLGLNAQGNSFDKRLIEGDTIQPTQLKKVYDPRKASSLSAMLPGLGQIYNDSWWKVPILYTGIGFAIYYIDLNNDNRILATEAVKDLLAQQAAGETISENRLRAFRRQADFWRKNRDLVILTLVGVYGLNIIDASIDAHLKGFNVSDNLATFKPKLGVINNGAPYVGIGVTIPIRSR